MKSLKRVTYAIIRLHNIINFINIVYYMYIQCVTIGNTCNEQSGIFSTKFGMHWIGSRKIDITKMLTR